MTSRAFDVVLFGATGFTGRLSAEALLREAPSGLRLGLAGRNRSRLEKVREGLGPAASRVELLEADSEDGASLRRLAEASRVVLSTVGPFAKHGLPLVEACAEAGTHYADSTGEVQFVRASIDHVHEQAVASKTRIVHACGFDSIPSDLGVWMLHRAAQRKGGSGKLRRVELVVERLKGGFSGGTVASVLNLLEEVGRHPELRRLVFDPYGLSPDRSREPEDVELTKELHAPSFDRARGRWLAPFLMASFNTRVVRRTNALLGYPYGRRFRYEEAMGTGPGAAGLARAAAVTAGVGGLLAAGALPPTRALLARMLPRSGSGPSEEVRQGGYFKMRVSGETEEDGASLEGRVEGESDPGYGETAKMLSQSALCLALDSSQLPERFGVLTPAAAMGDALLERLQKVGMTFTVERMSA